jgi:phenylalanine-4-hydroxylase
LLFVSCNLSCREDEVPQLQDVSEVLQQCSGYNAACAASLSLLVFCIFGADCLFCRDGEVPQLQASGWQGSINNASHTSKKHTALLCLLCAALSCREDEVPQLQDISEVLQAASGWQVRPVAGLMHPRDFLNGLAFK